jgi:hypothetical protein
VTSAQTGPVGAADEDAFMTGSLSAQQPFSLYGLTAAQSIGADNQTTCWPGTPLGSQQKVSESIGDSCRPTLPPGKSAAAGATHQH